VYLRRALIVIGRSVLSPGGSILIFLWEKGSINMIKIIPAIDIIEGKCVRLTRGDYQKVKIYGENPLDVAKKFEDADIQKLHLVDLDGAKERRIINWKILERIASFTSLKIDFGGGIQSDQDIDIAFECGAAQISAGSIAVKNKPLFLSWLYRYGPDKIILGADVHKDKISIHGWTEATDIDLFDFIAEYQKEGIQYIICTDISKDGMLSGPSVKLYKKIKSKFTELFLIASGGISSIYEIEDLDRELIDGVIIGMAIYEGKIKLEELKPFL
jgi:phosphoribosylformimino-5-aminoimidazole carboxamide ribotide isomerase